MYHWEYIMVKLQENKGQYFVSIPKDIIEKLKHTKKWEKGQRLTVSFNERGNIEISDTK